MFRSSQAQPKRIPLTLLAAQTKIVATLVGIVCLFYIQEPLAFIAFTLICVSLLWSARVSLLEFMRVVKPAAFILLISFVANTLVFIGHPDIIFSESVGLSVAGFYRSTVAIGRVLLALALVLSVASTTTPTQLADGFCVLLLPLRFIRVDVDGVSIVLSIALRSIPLTLEELDRIRQAQRARGFIFESGSIVERIKKWFTLLVPLTISLFQRADQMAQTMTDRCLGAAKRTRISSKMRLVDWAILLLWIALCACLVML